MERGGHGRSEGRRAYAESFDEYLDDVGIFLGRVKSEEEGKPVFLLGHSLGGTIAALFVLAKRPDIKGLILSGPLLRFSDDVPQIQLKMAGVVASVFPKMPVAKKLESRFISRDPAVVEQYDHDPLVYRGWMLAREAAEIIRAVGRVEAGMEGLDLPFIVLQGTNDHLANVAGSKELYTRAASVDKTLKLYDGLYHEVFNEQGKEAVLKDLVTWLDAHL